MHDEDPAIYEKHSSSKEIPVLFEDGTIASVLKGIQQFFPHIDNILPQSEQESLEALPTDNILSHLNSLVKLEGKEEQYFKVYITEIAQRMKSLISQNYSYQRNNLTDHNLLRRAISSLIIRDKIIAELAPGKSFAELFREKSQEV